MSDSCVLLVGPALPSLEEALRASYDVVALPEETGARADVLAEHGERVEVVVVSFGVSVDAALLDALPNVRAVANFGVGYDNVDVAEAGRRGIAVSNTPDVLNDSVAEVAVGLVLDVLHRLPAADRYVRAGRWETAKETGDSFPLTRQLSARRVGLLGLGRIGREIARRLEPFGCTLSYFARTPVDDVTWERADSPPRSPRPSTCSSCACPAVPQTAGLVDRDLLDRLGPDGVLVNIARGSVVDETALVDALLDGRLGGAGLDVYADEPRVPEALTALDQVVLLPHVGSGTEETRAAMGRLVLDNVRSFLDSGTLVTPVPTPR